MLSFFTIIYKTYTRIDKAVESDGSLHTLAEYMNKLRMYFRSTNCCAIIIHALHIHLPTCILDFGKAHLEAAAEYYNKYRQLTIPNVFYITSNMNIVYIFRFHPL